MQDNKYTFFRQTSLLFTGQIVTKKGLSKQHKPYHSHLYKYIFNFDTDYLQVLFITVTNPTVGIIIQAIISPFQPNVDTTCANIVVDMLAAM